MNVLHIDANPRGIVRVRLSDATPAALDRARKAATRTARGEVELLYCVATELGQEFLFALAPRPRRTEA